MFPYCPGPNLPNLFLSILMVKPLTSSDNQSLKELFYNSFLCKKKKQMFQTTVAGRPKWRAQDVFTESALNPWVCSYTFLSI